MKYIIKENEAGFLIKNGKFIKMLKCGKYNYMNSLGYKVYVEEMSEGLKFMEIPYEILALDAEFQKNTIRFQIPEGYIGLIYINNILKEFAACNEYVFWNVFEKYEMKLISMEGIEIGNNVTKKMLEIIPTKYYSKVDINEGEVGLVYYNNVLQKTLKSGIYYFWNYEATVTCKIVNMKLNELNIIGQEILTKDKIGIRMNVVCTYKIIDAKGATEVITGLEKQLYSYVQLIIRELVGNYRLDEILENKTEISEGIFDKLKQNQDNYFIQFSGAGIKDIILPGDIKEIMNTVLIAEKTAQANVITRREEVASTRSLLNTAKLMDENQTLYKLKELEYLEKICGKVGEISVSGNGDLIGQLGKLLAAK